MRGDFCKNKASRESKRTVQRLWQYQTTLLMSKKKMKWQSTGIWLSKSLKEERVRRIHELHLNEMKSKRPNSSAKKPNTKRR